MTRLEKEAFNPQTYAEHENNSECMSVDQDENQPGTSNQLLKGQVAREKQKKKEILQIRPVPWIRVNGSLNRRVLDRYAGAFVCYLISHSGSTFEQIYLRFRYLFPVTIYELLRVSYHL